MNSKYTIKMSKICFITAIYGNYETTCKRCVNQTVETDFVCFTDNPNIISNGWTIDTRPYHITNKSPLDNDTFVNSLCNNQHTFNIAKYYKQAFCNIPRLKQYDVVVWLDGTVQITFPKTSEYLLKQMTITDNEKQAKIVGWHHIDRHGKMEGEVKASNFFRYNSTFWNNQKQPIQDVISQYNHYLNEGYTDEYFTIEKAKTPHVSNTEHFGVWLTCFVAFLKTDPDIIGFLDMWYLQTLKYTTQDQIGFPYVCQKTGILPLTLPNDEITDVFYKHHHGI
jgi:hypothetical protein